MSALPRPLLSVLVLLVACNPLDLETPRAYPCAVDGGSSQCPEGWRCGLEGQCHQRGLAAAYLCDTDLDCEASWRCGPSGRCLDTELEALRPTTSLAGVELERLSPFTHSTLPLAVAASAWNGSIPSGPCGEVVFAETLSVVADAQVQKWVRAFTPMRLRADGSLPSASECATEGLSLRRDALFRAPYSGPPPLAMVEEADRTWILAEGGVLCTYTFNGEVGLSGSCAVAFDFAPTRIRRAFQGHPLWVVSSADQLATIDLTREDTAVAHAPINLDGEALIVKDALPMRGLNSSFVHLVAEEGLFTRRMNNVSVYDGGLLPEYPGREVFEPTYVGGLACGENTFGSYAPTALHLGTRELAGDPLLAVTARRTFGDTPEESIFLYTSQPSRPDAGTCVDLPAELWEAEQPRGYLEAVASCPAPCREGEELREVIAREEALDPQGSSAEDKAQTLKVEVLCFSPSTGTRRVLPLSVGENSCWADSSLTLPRSPRYQNPLVTDVASPAPTLQADGFGHLWSRGSSFATRAVVLDRAPIALAETAEGVMLYAAPEAYENRAAGQVARASDGQGFLYTAPTGFLAERTIHGALPVTAAVAGSPWLYIGMSDGEKEMLAAVEVIGPAYNTPFRVIAFYTPEDGSGRHQVHGALATNRAGGKVLLATDFDALLAADVTERAAEPPKVLDSEQATAELLAAPKLSVRLVPLNRTPITSLLALPPDEGPDSAGLFVEGYLLQAARIFHFSAKSESLWRADELELLEGEPLELFADGRRARVGLVDGSLFSLPSRVRLSTELPPEAGAAVDYASLCNHTFVLAETGLFTLQKGAATLATWAPVTIEASTLPEPVRTFTDGKLFTREGELWVTLSNGYVVRARGLRCE